MCGSVQLLPRQYNCGSTSILAMRAEAERPQNEMIIVASLSRDAVQVPPTTDEVDALPAASMVALPDELLKHIFLFRQACNVLEPRISVTLSSASHGLWALTQRGAAAAEG